MVHESYRQTDGRAAAHSERSRSLCAVARPSVVSLRLETLVVSWHDLSRHYQRDVIRAMMIVWRVKGKIIRSVLQYRVQQLCTVQCTHIWTDLWPKSCLLVISLFSFSVDICCVLQFICVRFSFLGLLCVIVYLRICVVVLFFLWDLVSWLCQEIAWEERLRSGPFYVEWHVKP